MYTIEYKDVSMNRKASRNIICLALLGIMLNLLAISIAEAQGGKGTIRGHVVDASGDVLQGARITSEQNDISPASDVRGDFFIRDLAPGSYTLTISYVGFTPVTNTVDVVAGQVASLDAKLEVLSQNQQVLVTAERAAGEAEAINRERSADNIVQVLTAEVIRSLPNANMADALGRLPSISPERDEGEGKYVRHRSWYW